MPVSFDKIQDRAPALVSLAKNAQTAIDQVGLQGQVARVTLCLDYSGSMQRLYADGSVQGIAERILALGTQFDDDGEIDVYFFGSSAWYAGTLTLENYRGGIDRLTQGKGFGTTNYAAAVDLVVKKSFGRQGLFGKRPSRDVPVYVAFITDGEPDSRSAAEAAFRRASKDPVFFQTVGVGKGSFAFLKQVDDLQGRTVDNVGFMKVTHLERTDDTKLFAGMLNEFPQYLQDARAARVLG